MGWIENGNGTVSFQCSDEKKNVFLIGDSIRVGYCAAAREALEDKAEVFYVKDNCRSTQYVIFNMKGWKSKFDCPEKIDLIQFNCGHWDVAHWGGYEERLTSESEYGKNIKMIIARLRDCFPNAKIVFATTTPMNPDGSLGINPRSNPEIDRYNDIAVQVAKEEGVEVNDLNAYVRDWGVECYSDYCHFTAEAFSELGKEVARRLRKML